MEYLSIYEILGATDAVAESASGEARPVYDLHLVPMGGRWQLLGVEEVTSEDLTREVLRAAAEGVALLGHGEPIKAYDTVAQDGERVKWYVAR
jgi:hypothetical protein